MQGISINDMRHHLEVIQKLSCCGNWELDIAEMNTEVPQFWSEEMFRILGYSRGEIIPSFNVFLNSVHPADRPALNAALQRSIEDGVAYDIQLRHILPDGRQIITRSVAKLIMDEKSGTPQKLCGATRDITSENEAFQAAEQTNKEMRTFFENVDEVLYSVDVREDKILQISPACEKVFGYTAAEMTENPHKWLEVVIEEDRHIINQCDPVIRRGEIASNEHRIRHKDGSIRWVADRLIPTLDERGNLVRIDGVCTDISARKGAELALKQSEIKFRTLLENSSDGITVTSAEGKLLFKSSSMLRITGYSDDLKSVDIPILFHPDDYQNVSAVRADLLKKPGSFAKFVARFLRKDGSWMWMEGVSRNLIHDPVVNGVLTNFRDVTEHVQYEANLQSAVEHLKKTNEELDRFVYSVSHDLRAPLASLLGLLEYTEAEHRDPELLQSLSMMKESVKKLDGFVLDILDYSKNTRMDVEAEAINFEELMNETIGNLKFMSRDASKVSVRWNISGNDVFYSDKIRLKMVFSNLISNAIRYANPMATDPYVAVDVTISPSEARILISDNGIGIDQKFHARIFDMFYRVSSRSVGSGLGLYIVKEAISKVNGRLDFSSEPELGTEFRLTIPNFVKC